MYLPTSPSAMVPLFNYLEQYHTISNEYKKAFEGQVYQVKIKKNKYLLSPIDQNACLYFLNSGIVRGFIKQDTKDITTWFSFGNEIIGAIRNPDEQAINSHEYLQALQDCELICIPYSFIDELYQNFPEANIIGRKMLAIQYYNASERSILSRLPNAFDRYNNLMSKKNANFNRVPLRCVASYLGIRLETLSRLRKKGIDKNQNLLH